MAKKLPERKIDDENIVGKVVVKPGEKVEFVVGVYENIIPQPNLTLEFRPAQGCVNALLGRVDGRGDYTLVYHFTNEGRIDCEVTVRASWDDAIWDSLLYNQV